MEEPMFQIRKVQKEDNSSLAAAIRSVLIEHGVPKVGTAYEDPELDRMFETYQKKCASYFVILKDNEVMGGGGIFPLLGEADHICELQKMYFHKSLRGRGIGDKMIQICIDFAIESGFRKCYIETMPNMLKAQKLYLKKGFKYLDNPLGNTGHNACPVWLIKNII